MRWMTTLAAVAAAVGLGAAQPPAVEPVHHQHPVAVVGSVACGKACVSESQKTTKTAYTSVCKEYCAADYSPLAVLRRCLGTAPCAGPCAAPLTKTVLVKKTVPGPDKAACVLVTPAAAK